MFEVEVKLFHKLLSKYSIQKTSIFKY